MIAKLYGLGFRGVFLDWFRAYLSNRLLYVKIKSSISDAFFATSGLPQGSHLGPLLFLIFVNDITSCFSDVEVLLFADDVKVFKEIANIDHCRTLQSNIDCLNVWCERNNLFLNVDKCKVLTFCRKMNPIVFNYTSNSTDLERVTEMTDLGIIFDEKLNFIKHIQNITNKSMKTLGFLLRTIKDFDSVFIMKLLYFALVRSQLEYNSVTWSPHYKVHIKNIERVQHKFLRFINFKLGIPVEHINYTSLNIFLNIQTLENRRKLNDLLFIFKILNSMFDCSQLLDLICIRVPIRCTRFKELFHTSVPTTNYSAHSPMRRIHTYANVYANNIDMFNVTFFNFKKQCNKYISLHS